MRSIFIGKKLSGRAIFLAIIISFISAILAFLFILSRYYGFVEITNINGYKQLTDNVSSAINVTIQKPDFIEWNKEISMNIYEDSSSAVSLKKYHWGIYNIASASAHWKNYFVERSVLYGQRSAGTNAVGLYLTDHGHYLAVAGDTYLSGNCFLPKLGARKAYIDGKSFIYAAIVNGTIQTSNDKLPSLTEEFIEYLENELFDSPFINDSLVSEDMLNNDIITNDFRKTTQHIHSKDLIDLDGIEISGNIIIQSDKAIRITEESRLKHIICIAPKIRVEKGFEGVVQLFAQDSLLIEEDVYLKYPSAAVVAGIGRSSANADLLTGSRIEGTVLLFAEMSDKKDVTLRISKDATVIGMVYCDGKVNINGKVFGSLYCESFILQTQQGYYENHLLDAWIDPLSLEPGFASGIFMKEMRENDLTQIIEWLE
jgi:cytoskeletal protein CcmA (bactofilin family)